MSAKRAMSQEEETVSRADARRIHEEILNLISSADSETWELAKRLWVVRELDVYMPLGYVSMRRYLSTLPFSVRKAFYLMRIEDWMRRNDLSRDQRESIEALGWRKAKEVALAGMRGIVTSENVHEWVALAQSLVCSEFESAARLRRRTGASPDHNRVYTFRVPAEVAEIIDRALERAKTLSTSDSPSFLLGLICTDFLGNDFSAPSEMSDKIHYLATLERMMGLRLIAIDEEGGIVYGEERQVEVVSSEEAR